MHITHKEILAGAMPCYHAFPDDGTTHPGLIIIHEIWGLTPHIKGVVDRYAAEGFSVVAPDMFYDVQFEGKIDETLLHQMRDPATRDEAQKKMRTILAPVNAPDFAEKALAKLKSCVDYLMADAGCNGNIGVLGFCYGGSYAFHLASHDGRIKAAVPFYGHPPVLDDVAALSCPVLAFYGDEDTRLMESLPKLKEVMAAAGKAFEAVVYPNAGHAFFNDSNALMYRADAASAAWQRSLDFLAKRLAP